MPNTVPHLIRDEVHLADETLAHLKTQMQDAVTHSLTQFMTPENFEAFWTAAFDTMRKQATVRTGRFILDGVGEVAGKIFWVAFAIASIWMIGGWELMVKFVRGARVLIGGGP